MSEDKIRLQRRSTRQRVPFGGFSYKLQVANTNPEYYYYWQKDVGDNLERMIRAGYEFVTRREAGRELPEELANKDIYGGKESLDDRVCVHGGRDEYGRDYKLYLMKQPIEYHLEDQAADAARSDAVDQAIRRQVFQGQSVQNKYGTVDITSRTEE